MKLWLICINSRLIFVCQKRKINDEMPFCKVKKICLYTFYNQLSTIIDTAVIDG